MNVSRWIFWYEAIWESKYWREVFSRHDAALHERRYSFVDTGSFPSTISLCRPSRHRSARDSSPYRICWSFFSTMSKKDFHTQWLLKMQRGLSDLSFCRIFAHCWFTALPEFPVPVRPVRHWTGILIEHAKGSSWRLRMTTRIFPLIAMFTNFFGNNLHFCRTVSENEVHTESFALSKWYPGLVLSTRNRYPYFVKQFREDR